MSESGFVTTDHKPTWHKKHVSEGLTAQFQNPAAGFQESGLYLQLMSLAKGVGFGPERVRWGSVRAESRASQTWVQIRMPWDLKPNRTQNKQTRTMSGSHPPDIRISSVRVRPGLPGLYRLLRWLCWAAGCEGWQAMRGDWRRLPRKTLFRNIGSFTSLAKYWKRRRRWFQ